MKKIILTAAIALMLSASASAQKNQATVNQYQGYLIFFYSTPVEKYIVLGTVKTVGLFDNIIKRAKKTYPTGEALIFEGVDMEDIRNATVIKFNEK